MQNCALRINPTQNGGHTRPHVTTAPGHQPQVHPSCPTETWDRAAAHAKMEHHLNLHACSILRWVTRGSVLARAFANCPTNDFASADHLHPTSSATTTKRGLAPGPMSSEHVFSLRFLAWSGATPSISAAPLLGSPSPRTLDTNVVSSASCTPPCSPSTTTSKRRLSPATGTPKSISLTNMLVTTLTPGSLQIRAIALSNGNPLFPRAPVLEHAAR